MRDFRIRHSARIDSSRRRAARPQFLVLENRLVMNATVTTLPPTTISVSAAVLRNYLKSY